MTLFFTSDIHFGHANIIGYCQRPFADVDAMNEGIIDRWNAVVGPDDHVTVIGDVAMGKIADTLPLVGRLNGTKVLLPGNHDRCWRGNKGFEKWRDRYLDAGFDQIFANDVPALIGDVDVLMSHFPYDSDERHEDRFADWLPADQGAWLLHGHVHDSWKVNGRQINVGVDVWNYQPVSIDQIAAIIQGAS